MACAGGERIGLSGHCRLGSTAPTASETEGPEAAAVPLSGRPCSDSNGGAGPWPEGQTGPSLSDRREFC